MGLIIGYAFNISQKYVIAALITGIIELSQYITLYRIFVSQRLPAPIGFWFIALGVTVFKILIAMLAVYLGKRLARWKHNRLKYQQTEVK